MTQVGRLEGKLLMKQFVKFGMVGAVNAIINYVVYMLCIRVGLHYVIANILSFVLSIFSAYLLQSRFVFAEDRKRQIWWKVLLKTYASYAFTGLILANLLSILWIDILDLKWIFQPVFEKLSRCFSWWNINDSSKYIAPILNMLVTIPINFIINKTWTYKSKKSCI